MSRTRQFNINALLKKLFEDFEDHFKVKLLSIADGTFDGIYSRRFKGLKSNKNSANGFNIPQKDVIDVLALKCIDKGGNLFLVPSKTDSEKMYLVDMTLGCCQCQVSVTLVFFLSNISFLCLNVLIVTECFQ